jgi:hypothetical protein
MAVEIIRLIDDPRLLLGIAEVHCGEVREAGVALREQAAALAARMALPAYEIPEERRRAVRQLLKLGGFSPTGRNRPSHELLLNDLKERGEFHHINNIVDVNNVLSLEALLPISIFDVDKLGGQCSVRVGREGEGYVFNQSGQWLDVKRCIVCCRLVGPDSAPAVIADGEPVGTPVKDSMATKIFEGASRYLGVIYGTTEGWSMAEMQAHTQRFAELLASESGGSIVRAEVL